MIGSNKKIITFILILGLLFGSFQFIQGVTKNVGETANISVICSDANGNLSQCNVTSPCSQTCLVSGSSGSCSCNFTCTTAGTFSACGLARDAQGSVDTDCLDTVICNSAPNKPLSVGEGETWSHCSFKDLSIPTLHWTYSDPNGDPQIAYEIRIDDNSSFPSTPRPDEFTDSGGGASTAYAPTPSSWRDWMDWNTNYWWIVRVKDSYNNWSTWSDANKFRTPSHAYPWSGFSWLPQEPNQKEVVVFDPEETGVYYFWAITEGEGVYTDETGPTNEEPHIIFLTATNKIKLKVTDSDAYSCESSEQEISAQLPLPEYKEVPPISWLKKIFDGVAGIFNGFLKLSNG